MNRNSYVHVFPMSFHFPLKYWKIPRKNIAADHIYEGIDDMDKLKEELKDPEEQQRVTELSVWNIIKKKLEQIKKLYEYLENINLIRFFDELFECYKKKL